ncbi:hypothetical protein BH23CHL4_BH23CHL4_14910 [soil metagenome]
MSIQQATYTRIFTDEAGESHFEECKVELLPAEFAPPAGRLNVLRLSEATSISLVGGLPDWHGDIPHPSPRRQFMCTMTGSYEVTASDGSRREFGPGRLLLLEDTHGKGHSTRIIDDCIVVAISLE